MIKYISNKSRLYLVALVIASIFTSCTNEIDLGYEVNNPYDIPDRTYVYMTNSQGAREEASFILNEDSKEVEFVLNLSKDAPEGLTARFVVDTEALSAYNTKNDTSYVILPPASYTLGDLVISEVTKSESGAKAIVGSVTLKTNNSLTKGVTYALPLNVEFESELVEVSGDGGFILFYRDNTGTNVIDANKSDFKIISATTMNSSNPLHNLCYKLKTSNKYLVDIVLLSAVQIGFDVTTQKPILDAENEKHRHVFDNADKYIQPLKDAGMKVMINLLGSNKYLGGQANLTEANMDIFVGLFVAYYQEYGLDGVLLDDEYTAGQDPAYSAITDEILAANTGLVQHSSAVYSMFAYKMSKGIKAVDPDAIIATFAWTGSNSGWPEPVMIEGTKVMPHEYLDIAISNYGSSVAKSANDKGENKNKGVISFATVTNMNNGTDKLNLAPYSQQFTTGNNKFFAKESQLETLVANHKYHMIWALDSKRTENWTSNQLPGLEMIADIIYDDELVFENNPEWIDWF